ncbi:MAG: TRAP transporter substrate-binding protein DctP [Rhodovibrionaceae bacterium]
MTHTVLSSLRRLSGRVLAGAVLTAALGLGAGAAEAQTTLRVTSQLPPSHPVTANLYEFKEIVEAESGGDLIIEIFDSAQLYKDSEVPQAVSSGAVEMGAASLTRYAGTIPAVDFFYVPFSLPTFDAVRAATAPDGKVRGLLDEAILETGARVLWWQALGGAVIMSDREVRLPEDMKGLKVRVFGKTLGDFVELLGGAPALISGSEQFLAYQRGTVDAGMSSAAGVKSRKIYEVLDYTTVSNHATVEFIVLINEDVWQGLTDKQRELITSAGQQVEAKLRDEIIQEDLDAIEFLRNETEMTVIELSDEELEAWKAASAPMIDKYIEASGELGKKVVEAAKELQ